MLRRLRIIFGALCFLGVSAAFLDFRDIAPESLKHTLASIQFVPSAIALAGGTATFFAAACVIIPVFTFFFGRVYCSTICPLGVFQDIVARFANKFRRKKLFLRHAPPATKLRYGILLATLAAVIAGFGSAALALLDPYSNFGRIAGSAFRPVLIFANNIIVDALQVSGIGDGTGAFAHVNIPWFGFGIFLPVISFFILVTTMSALRGRLYCNTICPVGTVLGLFAQRAIFRLTINKNLCERCGDCLRACKAQCIDLKKQEIDFSRCVGCFNCVSACDVAGIKFRSARAGATHQTAKIKSSPQSPASSRRAFIQSTVGGVFAFAGGALPVVAQLSASARNRDGEPEIPAGAIAVVSPPGAGNTTRFTDRCTACQLCVSACPSHVLEPTLFGYGTVAGIMKPRLNFDKSFCDINCTTCSRVCPDGAILPLSKEKKATTRIGLAVVDQRRCIVKTENTACGACAEHCPTAALQMKPVAGAPFPMPFVDPRYCIGCGACQYACPATPVKAVIVHGLARHEEAEVIVQEKVTAPLAGKEDFPF